MQQCMISIWAFYTKSKISIDFHTRKPKLYEFAKIRKNNFKKKNKALKKKSIVYFF